MKLLICTQAVDSDHPILGFFIGWISEFAKHFEEVHVICLIKGEYTLPPHVHVYSLGKEEGENKLKYVARFYRYFAHIFFTVKVDYVFYHMGAVYNILGAPFFFLRDFFHTKFFWWKAHGHINVMGKLALVFVDLVFTSTESGFSIRTQKKRVIGQAIDPSLFTLGSHEAREKKIIFVGRIMEVKRVDLFIETVALLIRDDPSLCFEIVGPIGDEAYFASLQQRIQKLGLENVVTFLGPKTQQELIGIYQTSLLFLNTSQTHSMDKTVLEAVLCGCVPVTGNTAFKDLCAEHGLYISDPSPVQYAASLRTLLQSDLSSLCMQLRQKVVSLHSLDTFTHRIFGI
jgi:glycosyltransferase involved in cell wall biosynthesis